VIGRGMLIVGMLVMATACTSTRFYAGWHLVDDRTLYLDVINHSTQREEITRIDLNGTPIESAKLPRWIQPGEIAVLSVPKFTCVLPVTVTITTTCNGPMRSCEHRAAGLPAPPSAWPEGIEKRCLWSNDATP
jgi:hypothetical protein